MRKIADQATEFMQLLPLLIFVICEYLEQKNKLFLILNAEEETLISLRSASR